MTEEAVQARLLDLIKRGKEIKARRVAIQAEIDERIASLGSLVRHESANLGDTTYEVRNSAIDILRPWPQGYAHTNRPPLNTIASLPRDHFNGEALWPLLTERQSLSDQLSRIAKQLAEAGLNLD